MDAVVASVTTPVESTPAPLVKEREYLTPEPAQEMPLEIYEAENSGKYIDKLLEVDNLLPIEQQTAVSAIDEYITQLMNEKGYNPTTEAYRATFEGLKKELGIEKHTSLETTLERLSKYVEAEQLLRSIHSEIESKILKQLKKAHTSDFIKLVMSEVEKKGL